MDSDHKWSIRFPETSTSAEVTPYDLTIRTARNKYKFIQAEFSEAVAEQMRVHTDEEGGDLRYGQSVDIMYDGTAVGVAYFAPNFVTYTDDAVHVEFHDLQESLNSGVVDLQRSSITLRDAYEYAFSKRTNDLLNDIKFAVPEENIIGQQTLNELVGQVSLQGFDPDDSEGIGIEVDALNTFAGNVNEVLHPFKRSKIRADATKELVNSYYAIDFDGISPATAIWKLNDMFGVETWVDASRNLWVGHREERGVGRVAAVDDERVWAFSGDDLTVTEPRDPIAGIVVEGKWVDQPGIGTADDIVSWFNQKDPDGGLELDVGKNTGIGDVRAEGVAFIPGVDPVRGKVMKVNNTKAARDALPNVAHMKLINEMRRQHSGTVTLQPEHSGSMFGHIHEIKVGDKLHIIPPSSARDCDSNIEYAAYVVTGVAHHIDSCEWTVEVDISRYPDFTVKKYQRFFDPRSGEYQSESDVFEGFRVFEDF